jgi:hypothetical protein
MNTVHSNPAMLGLAARARLTVVAAVAACTALAGCASMPGAGDTVTMGVVGAITEADLASRRDVAAARPALQAAGIGPAEIAAGRVVRLKCAVMTDGWWDSLAVLPAGLRPNEGQALVVEVNDPGDNARLPVNRVVAHVAPALGPGGLAYRMIPDWRERGLRNNYEEIPPQGGPRAAYLKVQGSWVVRCRP